MQERNIFCRDPSGLFSENTFVILPLILEMNLNETQNNPFHDLSDQELVKMPLSREEMDQQIAKLKKEYGWLISSIEDFNQQLENYSMDDQQRFRDLRRIFKNRIDAQRSETEQETKQKLKKEYGWLYNTSIEDFNQQLENYSMDDQQRFRDLRRRFKNRDAAMKSRLKRMNEFKELQLLKNLISSA